MSGELRIESLDLLSLNKLVIPGLTRNPLSVACNALVSAIRGIPDQARDDAIWFLDGFN